MKNRMEWEKDKQFIQLLRQDRAFEALTLMATWTPVKRRTVARQLPKSKISAIVKGGVYAY